MTAVAAAHARARAVPAWAWLVAIVIVSFVVRLALAHRIVTPWIMVDELIYSELAKSLASEGHFLVRNVPSNGYGFVYPALIAPAFGLFDAVPHAYAVAKGINAVVMSLAAIPAYLLARRLLDPVPSLVAAALTVAIPSMLYTGTLMTENVFYPIFLVTTLVLVLTLERPTPLRQLVLLALCGLAFATRAQAIAFLPAVLVAPVLHGWIERDLRTRLRRFTTLYGVVGGLGLLALLGTLARGRSPLSLLGAYRAATSSGYSFGDVLHYILWHAAELDLYVGVLPFAAALALWLAPRGAGSAARAYAAATLPLCVLFLVEVAAFASTESLRIEERNDFYLVPLLLIPLAGLADRSVVPRARRPVLVAAVVAGVLPLALPFGRFVNSSAVSDTFGLLPWWWLQDQGIHFGPLRLVALAAGLAAAAAFVFVPRRFAFGLCALVGALVRVLVDRRRERPPRPASGFGGQSLRRDPGAPSRLDRQGCRPRRGRRVRLALRRRDAPALEQRVLQPQRPRHLHRRRPRSRRRRPARDAGARTRRRHPRHRVRQCAARPVCGLVHRHRGPPGRARPEAGARALPRERPARRAHARERALPERHLVREARHLPPAPLRRRPPRGPARDRREPLRLQADRDRSLRRQGRRPGRDRARRAADARRAAAPGCESHLPRRCSRCRSSRVPAKVQKGSTDTRRLGAHFFAFDFTP